MRLVWIALVLAAHKLMRVGTRCDEWVTLRRRWTPLDAETVDTLEQHFRERYRAIDVWLPQQIGRLAPGGKMRYAAWRLGRRHGSGEIGVTLGAVSMKDHEPATRRRNEFFGMNSPSGEDCYPAPSAEDDYFDTLGTSANPYSSPREVGKRRRR